jgi:hypothetical protein
MQAFRTRGILAATFLMGLGCSGEIQAPGGGGPGAGSNGSTAGSSGSSGATGKGGSSGTTGTGGTSGTTGGGGTGAGGPGCVPGVPGTTQLPRLTQAQYDNTIRDLVGLETNPSAMLAPDSTGSVDQRAWDGYKAAADSIATQIMADAAARAKAIPCTPSGDGAACARQMIEQFGRRVFRRPLTAAEITRFETMYTNRAMITEGGTFDQAAQLIIRSFLLSPSFITRSETAGVQEGNLFTLSQYEVASRLSYMLWGSMPDEALFTAAAANELSTPEQILAQAQRLIADPRARTRVRAFHDHYAKMDDAASRWAIIQRDPAVYPAFADQAYANAFTPTVTEETRRIFEHITFGNGTFRDLFTTSVGFVNAQLAPIYGLPAAQYGSDFVQVALPAERPGIFTRAGFLSAFSLANRPSPIHRGAYIQKEVLCTTLGLPDPEALATPLPVGGATNRERVDAQTAGDECAGCHIGIINPTGFSFESFDAVGAWQTMEGTVPIDTAATILIGTTEVDVTGAADLMAKIADSPEAKRCYAQKWVEFAYERTINAADACTVDTLAQNLTRDGYSILNLVADLTQSQSFRYRAQEL